MSHTELQPPRTRARATGGDGLRLALTTPRSSPRRARPVEHDTSAGGRIEGQVLVILPLGCAAVHDVKPRVQCRARQSPAPAQAVAASHPARGRRSAAVPQHDRFSRPRKAFLTTYCVTCHNQRLKTGGLALDTLDLADVGKHAAEWEKVVVKLRAGLMPPAGMPRPQQAVIDGFTASLEAALDRAAAANPNPGRTEPFHRLNRAEYQNAIRDLLGLEVDATHVAADRRDQLRLRQHRRRAEAVAAADRAVSQRRAEGRAARARHAGAAQRRPVSASPTSSIRTCGSRGCRSARAAARGGLPGATGRRVRHQGPARPRHRLRHPALHRRAAARDQHRRRAGQGVHACRRRPARTLNIERQVAQAPGPARRRSRSATANGDAIPRRGGAWPAQSLDDDWVVRVPMKAGVHESPRHVRR